MTDQLMPALVAALAEIQQPKKSATNPHFKSKFADLAACMDAVREPLRKHGLAVVQTIGFEGDQDFLSTKLLHVSGQGIESRSRLLLTKQDAQGQGSAITYARRYALCAMLGLVAEPDDDGNAASKKKDGPAELSPLDKLLLAISAAATKDEVEALAKTAPPMTFAMKAQVAKAIETRLGQIK